MAASITSVQIKEIAGELGFDLVGIAPAEPIELSRFWREYLAKGYHGQMHYLERNVEKRLDPRKLLPNARSIICTATNYYRGDLKISTSQPHGKIARYARGRDYHDVIKTRLKKLSETIRSLTDQPIQLRCFVDTGPLVEKAHAARAGLGWIGKNTLLINKRFGSYLLLGEIVTDLELDYDEPIPDNCRSCSLCLQACPTNAFVEPRILDARSCISYLTVESKQTPAPELAAKLNGWLFGCDLCQDTCPFNKTPIPTKDPDLQPHPQWSLLALADILTMTEQQFHNRFTGSCLERTGLAQLKTIAQLCQKNPT